MIARVFPRKTNVTPDDEYVYFGDPPLFGLQDDITEVHVSTTFTWDIPYADYLAKSWERTGLPVKIGGVAFGDAGGQFEPGMYLKKGHVITSRGCCNKCWFCDVWKRTNGLVELEVREGNILHDDNILACSPEHIQKVFAMLATQKNVDLKAIEAKLLTREHVNLISSIKLQQIWCAYDTPDDLEPLIEAGKLLKEANITIKNRKPRCYVLIGYPKDTIEQAKKRMHETILAGFIPFAMYYQGHKYKEPSSDWSKFRHSWTRVPAIMTEVKKLIGVKG